MPFLSNRAAKGLSQAAALSVLAASGLILANPGSAEAADCNAPGATTAYSISDLTSGGFSCTIGDKEYSAFAFNTGNISNANKLKNGSFSFSIDPKNGDHIFSGASLSYTGTGFNYQYKVSLLPSSPIGQAFYKYNTSFTDSSTDNSGKYRKVLKAYMADGTTQITGGTLGTNPALANAAVTADTLVIITNPRPLQTVKAVISDGPYNFAAAETGPIVFKATFTRPVNGGRIDVTTDSVTQLINNTNIPEAPAPLPILGAGAAFGLSRKLRRRIKLA